MDGKLPHNRPKASRSTLRNAILIIIFGLALGILIDVWWFPVSSKYLDTIAPEKILRVLVWIFSIIAIGPLIACYLTMRLGLRIVRTQSFPPPGTGVWKNTQVMKGRKATFRGIFLISLSVIIIGVGILIGIVPHKLCKLMDKQSKERIESIKSPPP
jgi:MFS family permease